MSSFNKTIELEGRRILTNQVVYGFGDNDAVRVRDHRCMVTGCHIIDTSPSKKAHKDMVQLYCPSKPGEHNDQYAAGTLRGVSVNKNTLFSEGHAQGVFGSDGLFEDMSIVNNVIDTKSQHEITLNGLLSGQIAYNAHADGTPCIVQLGPLRFGGNPEGQGNVWVLGMLDRTYDAIETDPDTTLLDTRRTKPSVVSPGDVYLTDVYIDEFREEIRKMPYGSTKTFAYNCQSLAKHLGYAV